jgi:hypothetical protein
LVYQVLKGNIRDAKSKGGNTTQQKTMVMQNLLLRSIIIKHNIQPIFIEKKDEKNCQGTRDHMGDTMIDRARL